MRDEAREWGRGAERREGMILRLRVHPPSFSQAVYNLINIVCWKCVPEKCLASPPHAQFPSPNSQALMDYGCFHWSWLFVLWIFISSGKDLYVGQCWAACAEDVKSVLCQTWIEYSVQPCCSGSDLTLQIEVVLLEGWSRDKSSVCERSAIVWRDKIIKMSEPPLAGSPARGWTLGYLWPSGPPLCSTCCNKVINLYLNDFPRWIFQNLFIRRAVCNFVPIVRNLICILVSPWGIEMPLARVSTLSPPESMQGPATGQIEQSHFSEPRGVVAEQDISTRSRICDQLGQQNDLVCS